MRIRCLIAFSIFILSCSQKEEKRQYYYLKRQLTPDRKYYIYTYLRGGSLVTSNEVFGRRLISVSENFKENAGIMSMV